MTDYNIIRGTWQLSTGHLNTLGTGSNVKAAIKDCISNGFQHFDTADIYTGMEEALGECLSTHPNSKSIKIHTKYVPDLDKLYKLDYKAVESSIDRSLRRLKRECIDLVQFHWWDFSQPGFLDILAHLFQQKSKGKVHNIGLTNFDSHNLKLIVENFPDIYSLQCQISLLDHRSDKVRNFCYEHNIKIFSYGTLAGGFISDSWLNKPQPDMIHLANRSLVKYKLIIDDWGGWDKFQDYLSSLRQIANKYQSTISQVARRAILQTNRSSGLIIGISPQNYHWQNKELMTDTTMYLTHDELEQIFSWSSGIKGDLYELERDRSKSHSQVMKYNLNQDTAT